MFLQVSLFLPLFLTAAAAVAQASLQNNQRVICNPFVLLELPVLVWNVPEHVLKMLNHITSVPVANSSEPFRLVVTDSCLNTFLNSNPGVVCK